jgi:hypothetical protein
MASDWDFHQWAGFLGLYFLLGLPLWVAFYGFEWAHRMDVKLAAKRAAKKVE